MIVKKGDEMMKGKKWIVLVLILLLVVSLLIGVYVEIVYKGKFLIVDKNGVFYEVYVNFFYDVNKDGYGDLKGFI